VEFVWHGGEPTLCGLDFFKKAVEIQNSCNRGKEITNAIQTNGSLLDDQWCRFLKENRFMVGLSLDGPEHVHNLHRHFKGGGSFKVVYRALELLNKHGVEYNILACVSRGNSRYAVESYRFFKDSGVKFIQFTPIIERLPDQSEAEKGQLFGGREGSTCEVAEWTVKPEDYSQFLIDIFDIWVRNDVGDVFVMNFEAALTQYVGNPAPSCIHARQCGRALVVEKNGDVFACDHHVYPEYRLGNVREDFLKKLANASISLGFGREKEEGLSRQCLECDVLHMCGGGCPKHRFVTNSNGERHNYMCKGYREFFHYSARYLDAITKLLVNGLPASKIMDAFNGPLVIVPKK
jgi:uncharacterized protein